MVNAAVTFGIDPAGGRPERGLALGYAPVAVRAAMTALFALDATLAHLARGTRDPLVAEMRLTWWFEALVALDAGGAPPAHPVLQALCAEVLPRGITGAAVAEIVQGWEALLDDNDVAQRHALDRGRRLFTIAGRLLGAYGDPVAMAGEGWALGDLAATTPDPALGAVARGLAGPKFDEALRVRWSKEGRALGALAHVARMDLGGSPPGSPRRVGRIMFHRLTGR